MNSMEMDIQEDIVWGHGYIMPNIISMKATRIYIVVCGDVY